MYACSTRRRRQEDVWDLPGSQSNRSSQTSKLQIQQAILSQKIRWTAIEEDTLCQPLASAHMCTHVHTPPPPPSLPRPPPKKEERKIETRIKINRLFFKEIVS